MSKDIEGKRNLKVMISYNGAAYHGFQRQANAVTVQQTLEAALAKLLGHDVVIIGCSRTDAGVHAREFCFNARTSSAIPCDGFVRGLNALLPCDIAVHSCEDAPDTFHARYDAVAKEYDYVIHTSSVRDVFSRDLVYRYCNNRSFNLKNMNESTKLFVGEHDFSAYCKAESLELTRAKKRGTIRNVHDLQLSVDDERLTIVIAGDGFLHNMVRIIAGTLLYVGEGKMSVEDVRQSLDGGCRESAGKTLPACGLYLNRVVY
ncbi:MAG: tRNA pseudouridine(38-40) synthase TruA [Oscillospiraceae bacterium]|nr:tRNA pseudouridine(38-40) synthase TruA [Oscillospiraceae bacterium]